MLKSFYKLPKNPFVVQKSRTKQENNQTKCITDRGVLLLQLTHNCRVIPLASHEKPKHLLSVFGHDEL